MTTHALDLVDIFVTTFGGLATSRTWHLTVPHDFQTSRLHALIYSLLPQEAAKIARLTTTNGRQLCTLPAYEDVSSLAKRTSAQQSGRPFVPLRLNARLVGGKGGFGSQLRAAGGRMSTRKKKQNAELATGSARNLDGRRIRTITEAKNLATYLATKPDMDRKEKEERRKRWEAVVELAEQREADMRSGKTIDGRRKGLSSEWLEEKDEVGENIKNAVKLAMTSADREQQRDSTDSNDSAHESADEDSDAEDPMELDEDDMKRLRNEAEAGDADALWILQHKLKIPKHLLPEQKQPQRRFAGFDEDISSDEEVSDREEGEDHSTELAAGSQVK